MQAVWYLERFESWNQGMRRIKVRALPFLVGRRSGCDLWLTSNKVSQRHAEIFQRDDSLWLRDLGSTNGTFVNGEQVSAERRLDDGDVLHFANFEFRLIRGGDESQPARAIDLAEEDRVALEGLWQTRRTSQEGPSGPT